MKIKPLVLSLMSGVLLASQAYAAADEQQTDELMRKINSRTQALEQQVKELQQQLRVLKAKQVKPAKQQVVTSTETQKASTKSTEAIAEHYFAGTPVVTSPYYGKHSQFDGSDLIVNVSSINQDLGLVKQWQGLGRDLEAEGKAYPDSPILAFSGKAEAQAGYKKSFTGSEGTDIDLTGLELDSSVSVNNWVSGFVAINYDNDPADFSATRTQNSKLFVNKAFFTIADLDKTPFYVTAGQLYVPFGQYSSFMVSSPLTQLTARTKARAVVLGYYPKSYQGLYGQVYGFKGDSHTESDDGKVNSWGVNVAYDFVGQGYKFTVGTSYINNMADASGMQKNGVSSGFTGFGATNKSETLQHYVPGVDVQGKLTAGPVVLLGEYLTATRSFDAKDMMYNQGGAKPSAMNFEAAYLFDILTKPSSIAIGYGQTAEALSLNLPKERYSATISTSIWRDTLASIEYRHDVAYSASDTGGNVSSVLSNVTTPSLGLGEKSDSVIAQFGIYF